MESAEARRRLSGGLVGCLLLLSAAHATAQPPQPPNVALTQTVTWDVHAPAACAAPCSYEVELDGELIGVVSIGTITFPNPPPGLHAISIVAVDALMRRSAPSTKTWIEKSDVPPPPPPMPTECPYTPPGGTASTRPIGYTLQGVNPDAGQAARIAQLRKDGWLVEWQWDPALRRMLLMAECKGVIQP